MTGFPLSPHHLYTDCYRPLGRCSISRLGFRASNDIDSFSAPLIGAQWSRFRARVKNVDARFLVKCPRSNFAMLLAPLGKSSRTF